ncbi:hypothetical protein DICSQDRAFT_179161 [Dichomitus squalens LYAD-421 SS1]|uniref:uncharacterized protein n=1 Tax=Dichomitus squalens (strain LYAD-421) TaxID=732165 RepID=UPI00044136A5|nr:uncharacterized protein DICSQDRAFT_179161 [Dichomitus squalens LYAD-421 SS1]EJF63944.1 hypothetical protein DICSQDRAFT_179161 [Dichomitus squalens LYAD-421 SS1]
MATTTTGTPLTEHTGSSSSLKLLSRFSLPRTTHCQPMRAFLLAGGEWLVAIADLNPRYPQEGPDCTGISLWDLRDLSSPRCVAEARKQAVHRPFAAAEVDKKSGHVKVLLGYDHLECGQVAAYDFSYEAASGEPSPIVYEIPSHPDHAEGSSLIRLTNGGDIFACVVQDYSRLEEFRNNPEAQLKPLVPPAGVDEIYLVHMPTNKAQWLHSRHLSSFHRVRVFICDDHIYLLGRTPTTYVLRHYRFSPSILLDSIDDTHLDLGELLAEYESPPLSDPSIPWGSCDSEDVFLDPTSHASVLAARHWFAGGYYIRFPLQGEASEVPEIVSLEPETHLPDNATFFPRWLGRDQALMYSSDDCFANQDRLFRLSFSHSDFKGRQSVSGIAVPRPSTVSREDFSWFPLRQENQLMLFGDPAAVTLDEESGRICLLLHYGEGLILSRSLSV